MDFGELLAGAGRIGRGAREEAQRLRDYERDRAALAEMRRMEAMRESLARGGVPETPPEMLRFGDLDYGFQDVPVTQPAPVAPVPAAPAATPTAAPAPIEQPIAKPLVEPPSLNEEPLTAPGTLSIPRGYQGMTAVQLDNLIRDRRRQIRDSTWLKPNDKKQLLAEVAELEKQRDAVGGAAFAAETALIAQSRARIAELEKQRTGGRWGTIPRSARKEIEQLKLDILNAEKRIRDASSVPAKPQAGLDVGEPKPATAPAELDTNRLYDAMVQVESGGDPNAVSEKGAVGLGQVLPATAMDPGYGVSNIFDFVKERFPDVSVGKRTEQEAKRLLQIPKVGYEYGKHYLMIGLIPAHGTQRAVAAYHMGPGNAEKWKAGGYNPQMLGEQTRSYADKVLSAYYGKSGTAYASPAGDFVPGDGLSVKSPLEVEGKQLRDSAIVEPAATRGIIPAAAAAPVAAPQRVEPSAFRAQENAMPEALRQYQRQRAEHVRLAKMYQQAGMGAEVQQLRGQIIGMDNDFLRMQGMQGLQEFAYGDPKRLSAVWSAYAGTSIGIQPRSDGKFNLFVGGQKYGAPMEAEELTSMARSAFDTAYQQQRAAISAEMGTEAFKSGLRVREKQAEQTADMIKQIYIERAKSAGALDAKRLELRGFDVKPSGTGDGMFVITAKDGSGAWAFNSKPTMQEINGVKVPAYDVFPIKLPGLR